MRRGDDPAPARRRRDHPLARQGGVTIQWRCEWFACTRLYFTWDKATVDHIEWNKIAPRPTSDEGTQIEVALFGGPLAAGTPQPLTLPEELDIQPCPAGCRCRFGVRSAPVRGRVQITVPVTVAGKAFNVALAVPASVAVRYGRCR